MTTARDIIVSSHQQAIEAVRSFQDETSTKYVSVTTQKHYGKVEFDYNLDHKKIRWQLECSHPIPFDGIPFIFIGKRILQCHMGPDRQAKLKEARRLEKEQRDISKKPHARANTTKKVDCPAEVSIKCIAKFPEYKLSKDTGRLRKSVAAALRRDLAKKGRDVPATLCYHVHLPGLSDHKHHKIKITGAKEQLDPEIVGKIQELVSGGVDNIKELEQRLGSFVRNEVLPTDSNLAAGGHRYNPTAADTRSHLRRARNSNSGTMTTGESVIESWSNRMWSNVQHVSSFQWEGEKRIQYRPFIVNGIQVGVIPPLTLNALGSDADLFQWTNDGIHLSSALTTYAERTAKVADFLQRCRETDAFVALRGWRNENYAVSKSFSDTPLLEMERSATSLFGIKQYGVHVNGYCRHPTKGLCLWIGRRSPTKQTYPNKLDNIAAGGLAAGLGVKECMMKECEEEASIPREVSEKAVSVGTISYFFEDERGLFPETQFIFDLELSPEFEPKVCDGEVSEFFLWPVEKVKKEIASDQFKPNCGLVNLDFLLRHGYITPDTEPHYIDFTTKMHQIQF
ncbi:uncharacterized protein [Diadema setosum]|uniref:uncharacterized protein n=1 Tax=Diadema setosum TaxID=31175 RepID=UPI003B3A8B37